MDGEPTIPNKINVLRIISEDENKSQYGDKEFSNSDSSKSSQMSAESTTSRRAHRIANMMQQERPSIVNLDDNFLRSLSCIGGKGDQIRASVLAANDNAQGFDGLDKLGIERWEKSVKRSGTVLRETNEEHSPVQCIYCKGSKYSAEQLTKAKRAYTIKFIRLKEHMKDTYERRAEEIKKSLVQMFNIEYAKLHDIYTQNRRMCERLMTTDKALLNTII